ncbi:hypothetical protein EO98_17400 [Methanosarcina sp. 2.H.T.1A.6]|uniref:hypothetical protein n=1 Tax=unclassified Methanosarcina TaxID=2644672 RepID=UPI0006219B96|nr:MULTISPECIES: hypothetical protein [unclassified Methanosarcina]KKG14681.1 hypothetical protein EO94_01850 [Methanosarcina sp. 2.H.T.1A.3]KKG16312.1 hypothetical protein EO97_17160 [Methanosarcina sp. 2.H.T.1A.15]KKG22187.1 hypothetical protein EO96_07920 [Methanosarcina sp. 2.H.T.1A.8]KKG24531.1 hypothetical protein EO98_17400 [Methanosarcina sp. 2.H.T.1A.6]
MRNIIKYGIFLVGALSLLTLNALALSNPSNDNTELENNSNEAIGIDICIDFIPYTHEELRDKSDTIVIGTVKEILPPRWNTIDGKKPKKLLKKLEYPDDIIYTDIVISIDEYLKNPLSSRELIVRVTGGTVGDFSMTTDADPSFNAGEKVLLYLRKDTNPNTKDIGHEHFIVTDFYRGKYTLTGDGKAITHDETVTLDKLLSTINQTDNNTNNTEASDNTETVGKQEGFSSTIESKRIPFISFFWMLAAVLAAVLIVKHR